MKALPYILIAIRFLFAPIIFFLAYGKGEGSKFLILTLMYIGLLTDIFDGIIARKAGVSSQKLRRLDSQTDLVFWLSLGFAVYFINPKIIVEQWQLIILIFSMEALCYVVSFVKFGKETCTHAWLSKLWGITLIISFTYLIGFQEIGWAFYLMTIIGFVSHLDVILIIFILPKWQYDVPSAFHAWKIRQGKQRKKSVFFN